MCATRLDGFENSFGDTLAILRSILELLKLLRADAHAFILAERKVRKKSF
jgi:hypothetical protein